MDDIPKEIYEILAKNLREVENSYYNMARWKKVIGDILKMHLQLIKD